MPPRLPPTERAAQQAKKDQLREAGVARQHILTPFSHAASLPRSPRRAAGQARHRVQEGRVARGTNRATAHGGVRGAAWDGGGAAVARGDAGGD
eukprot:171240-Chlamydomonas_euryale.AAC.7